MEYFEQGTAGYGKISKRTQGLERTDQVNHTYLGKVLLTEVVLIDSSEKGHSNIEKRIILGTNKNLI